MTLDRTIRFKGFGKSTDVQLIVDGPYLSDDGKIYFKWSAGILQPSWNLVFGDDEMEALYICLNSIATFMRGMERQGCEVWYREVGDHGGFVFGEWKKE
jgi:hypothetical protein